MAEKRQQKACPRPQSAKAGLNKTSNGKRTKAEEPPLVPPEAPIDAPQVVPKRKRGRPKKLLQDITNSPAAAAATPQLHMAKHHPQPIL